LFILSVPERTTSFRTRLNQRSDVGAAEPAALGQGIGQQFRPSRVGDQTDSYSPLWQDFQARIIDFNLDCGPQPRGEWPLGRGFSWTSATEDLHGVARADRAQAARLAGTAQSQ